MLLTFDPCFANFRAWIVFERGNELLVDLAHLFCILFSSEFLLFLVTNIVQLQSDPLIFKVKKWYYLFGRGPAAHRPDGE